MTKNATAFVGDDEDHPDPLLDLVSDIAELASYVSIEEDSRQEWVELDKKGLISEELWDRIHVATDLARKFTDQVINAISHSDDLMDVVTDSLKQVYTSDVQTIGFPRSCGVLSILKDFHIHRQPTILVTPMDYPAHRLATHAILLVNRTSTPTEPGRKLATISGDDPRTVNDLIRHQPLDRDKASSAALVCTSFDQLDWGLQRGLYDLCHSQRIPLIATITAHPDYDPAGSQLRLDHEIEIGVRDRYPVVHLSASDYRTARRGTDIGELTSTIQAAESWVQGLFPFRELLQEMIARSLDPPLWTLRMHEY